VKFIEVEPDRDPFAEMLKAKLTEMIRWYDQRAPRALQREIGPSEIGVVCDRRIGYRLAQVKACNEQFDPLPAIMGTAFHLWVQSAVEQYREEHGSTGAWLTEQVVYPTPDIMGHSDLYWTEHEVVIDWKTAGPDVMRKILAEGPPESYQIQAQVYGYGFETQGRQVKKVALAFLNRAGLLSKMFVWTADYDRDIAIKALQRVYAIAQQVIDLDPLTYLHRWEQVPATPGNDCGFCPWFNAGKNLEQGASDTGCPGR
jgi:hypothetical protein